MRGQPGLRTVAGQWKIGQIGERLLTQLAKSEFQTGVCPLFMHVGIFPTCMDFFFRVCACTMSLLGPTTLVGVKKGSNLKVNLQSDGTKM